MFSHCWLMSAVFAYFHLTSDSQAMLESSMVTGVPLGSVTLNVSVNTLFAISPHGIAGAVGFVLTSVFVPKKVVVLDRFSFVTTGVHESVISATDLV